MLLREPLFKAARFFSKKEAIVCEEDRFTYGEFPDRLYRLANDQAPGYRERWKSCHSSPKLPCFHGGSLQYPYHGSGPSPDQLPSLSPADAFFLEGSESQVLIASPDLKSIMDEVPETVQRVSEALFSG